MELENDVQTKFKKVELTVKNENIGDRLKLFRKILSLTQKKLAISLGVTQSFCGGIEKSRYGIPIDMIIKLRKLYNLNPNWLLTGEGDVFLDKHKIKEGDIINSNNEIENSDISTSDDKNVIDLSDFIGLPLMNCKISAGNGAVAIDEIKATLMFRRDWLSKFGDPQKLSLIEVVGDSMEPTFKSGDIILVNHNQNYLDKAGGIYAIAVKNEDSIMVKRLQYDYQSGKILVMSDNKLYQSFLVSEDEIAINGRVVWYGREI